MPLVSLIQSLLAPPPELSETDLEDEVPSDLITTLIRFEEPDGMPVSDDAGGLLDLNLIAGYSTDSPGHVQGPAGQAYRFDGASNVGPLAAQDATTLGTLRTRDMTFQALIAWDLASQSAWGAPGCVIARGKGNALAEYMPFAIELRVVNAALRIGEVYFLWNTSGGTLKTQVGGQFVVPVSSHSQRTYAFFLLTATRRWISTTEVSLRYYVNAQRIADIVSSDGDIGGSTTGTTSIGARFTGAAYGNELAGAIDELLITNYEMSAEEIEDTYLRISTYQPDGYRQIKDLMPPGIPISPDPTSTPQQDLRSIGMVLGFADSRIENMRSNLMPDRAYGDMLRRWEAIAKTPPKSVDSIEVRRNRVCGQLAKHGGGGYVLDAITEALAPILQCAPSQLQLFAFSDTIGDTFDALDVQKWNMSAGVDVTGNKLRMQGNAGTSYAFDAGNTTSSWRYAFLPVTFSAGLQLYAKITPTALPAGSDFGLAFFRWATNDAFLFGLQNIAGTYKVGYQRYEGTVAIDGAWQNLATTGAVDHYLRLKCQNGITGSSTFFGPLGHANYTASWSTVGNTEANFSNQADLQWINRPDWAGFYFRGLLIPINADVRVANDFGLRDASGRRPFHLYVFRDPAIPGKPDLVGAQSVLSRMKHGYTHAAVITSKSLLAGVSGQGCNLGPMGCL